nr:UDP-glycosyltransferase 71K1-like [Coffea arabica]
MKTEELVFVPAPGRGHMVSMIEFAKRLLERDERISITVLVIRLPTPSKLESYVEELAAANSNIRFIDLPSVDRSSPELSSSIEKSASVYIEKHKPLVQDAIINHVLSDPSTHLAGLVIDLFCTSMIDIANELGVPSYVFFTSSAAFLGLMLYLPVRHSLKGTEFSISDPDSIIPAYTHPVPSRVLPSFLFDETGGYESMLYHGTRFREAKGLIINTFAELEPHAIKSLESDKELAPIYTIGPVLNFELDKNPDFEKIIKWLDDQPSSSVLFLCFGSLGGFEPPQLAEMAAALERSGYRFLWSVRAPMPRDFRTRRIEYTNFSEILPEGFFERTKDKGLVCGWAPQLDVLAHEAVGGFVSHCGWNSILESLWNGVPIATWPVYAEQQSSAFQLVKDLELAVELTLDYRFKNPDKLVPAKEIEKAIRCLMDSENPVRRRVKDIGKRAREALMDGGSSFISLGRFIEDLLAIQK